MALSGCSFIFATYYPAVISAVALFILLLKWFSNSLTLTACHLICSGPLLQNLLAQQEEQIFVAAVPVAQDLAEGQEGAEEADTVSVKIGDVATAARVMQMLRVTQVSPEQLFQYSLKSTCRS